MKNFIFAWNGWRQNRMKDRMDKKRFFKKENTSLNKAWCFGNNK